MTAWLTLYRSLGRASGPLMRAYLRRRAHRGKEDPARLAERFGKASAARPDGSCIWVHCASVGELNAILPIVRRLHETGSNSVVTTGTVTSADLAGKRLPASAVHQFVPLDVVPWIDRFLSHWRPQLIILTESEVWPALVEQAGRRNIPVIVVNGRMSPRSFAKWSRAKETARRIFSGISVCLAASDDDADRFRRLGCPTVHTTGNIKYDGADLPANDADLAALAAAIGDRPVWIAASTHAGEEAIIADCHMQLAERQSGLLTIIVPRHPERGADIAADLAARGVTIARRFQKDELTPATDILLADTIGELGLFYRLASIAFIGKSLTGDGGQNPIEAIRLDCAIIHGPGVSNFSALYDHLDAAGGAELVSDGAALQAAVERLLRDPAARLAMAEAANTVIQDAAGAVERTWSHLHDILQPMEASVGCAKGADE